METTQFKKVVNDESNRLESLCVKWQNVLETSQLITEDLRDQIRTTIGQARLLIKEKLQQFRDLLGNYESGRGDVNITQNDLEGFWDLVSIQVNELNEKFSQLELTGRKRNMKR